MMQKTYVALLLSSFAITTAWAQAPVHFADAKLKTAVEEQLWIPDPTPTDMLALTELECTNLEVRDLTGLEYATNLYSLNVRRNNIQDVTPLSGLTNLKTLILEFNQISDISILSGLGHLEELSLEENEVSDISSLSGLSHLRTLNLHRNEVSDLSALTGLTRLEFLDLRINPLSREAYTTYIAQITANNPGIVFLYDPTYERHLVISSTPGGVVIQPGEGDFEYEYRESVWLEARPDPCFVFVKWTGTFTSTQNPLFFTMTEDHKIQASFRSIRETLYVDDDAPGDLGPGDSLLSDPRESGAPDHPLDTVQEAVDMAGNRGTIVVRPGTYPENIDIPGKSIRLLGYDPNDPDNNAWPVIDGGSNGRVIRVTGFEGSPCEITGFIITGGMAQSGAAIICSGGELKITNCFIVGNRATNIAGSAVSCVDSNATFINCTFSGNYGGSQGAGLVLTNSAVTVCNSVLWGNTPREVFSAGSSEASILHSIVAGGWPGSNSADVDPLFVDAGCWVDRNHPNSVVGPDHYDALWLMGDYHVRSQAGRWNPLLGTWMNDTVTSPCIDAGNPASPVGWETSPNGGIINLGAYGGTPEASKSPDHF